MRGFLAVELPEEILAGVIRFKRECEAVQRKDIKYVEDGNLHITLKFLGEITDKQLEGLRAGLASVSAPAGAVTIAGTGAFPGLKNPKVLWIGVREDGSGCLSSLFRQADAVCSKHGVPREERPFRPHLTFARVKGIVHNDLKSAVGSRSGDNFGSFVPDEFCLFQSRLTENGPVYTKIAVFPIQKAET